MKIPRYQDFPGLVCDGQSAARFRLLHGFNGPVKYWPVELSGFLSGGPCFQRDPEESTKDLLVLIGYGRGVATVRVEEVVKDHP